MKRAPHQVQAEQTPKQQSIEAPIDRQLRELDGDIAKRAAQRTDIMARREAAQAAAAAAQTRREDLRLRALADADASAQESYQRASEDHRRAADQVAELAAVLAQLDGELNRLNRDRKAALQASARAQIDAIGHGKTVPLMAAADQLVDQLVDVLRQAREAKNAQATLAAAADLPVTHKRFTFDYVDRVLRFRLASYGAAGIRHHQFRERTLAECEAAVQGFATEPPPDDAGDGIPERAATVAASTSTAA